MQTILQAFILLLITLPFSSSAAPFSSQPHADITELLQQAESKKLYTQPYWLALLHYKTHNAAKFNFVSDIISTDFFLSADGKSNPKAELVATLHSFFTAPAKNHNTHPQCRFVARYQWLQKKLDWGELKVPEVHCENYQRWSQQGHVNSVSLIFASGFLGNPASYYGHLLLKFNGSKDKLNISLLDQSINYGALVPANENMLLYIYKGIFGGYSAIFSNQQFYKHNLNYVEHELRDLWEYELDLSEDEVKQLLSHSWELLGKKYKYYFLKENCAYRMSELLGLVISQPLLNDNLPWSIPTTVFDHLVLIKQNSQPLVKKVSRIPSRQNSFTEQFLQLNKNQKKITGQLVKSNFRFTAPNYTQLEANKKIGIIDTLINYNAFLTIGTEYPEKIKQQKIQLLIERSKLASNNSKEAIIPNSLWPSHMGPKPTMVRISALHNSLFGSGLELQFRPAYYDMLSLEAGRLANSKLTMFDLKTVYLDKHLSFRSLDLVNIETLNLSKTNLPGDGGMAWKVNFGFTKRDLSCLGCNVFRLTGGIGRAVSIFDNSAAYIMLEPFVQSTYNQSGTYGLKSRLSMLISLGSQWKSQLSLGRQKYFNGLESNEPVISWENRFGNSRDWDIRLGFKKHIEHEWQLSASFYW